jgi:hypothetical protein
MKASSWLILSAAALIGVGVANIDIKLPSKTVTKTVLVPVPKEVVRVKKVRLPARAGDGYVTAQQCHALNRGERFRDIVAHYGWPAGEQATQSDYEYLAYRISNNADENRECQIDFFEGGVDRVDIERAF